ncbi:sialidase family protein [Allomuricauda sp. CP2A]|uniref:sialidase family protein n=1 Tax=Allomuricauda sp. CP2A TaxID=1848189 RepID=UPI00159EEA8C|nr:sialidase family protein [Muricauda sp. CP2A]
MPYKIISKNGIAREYQAVPDACRLKNGDIVVVYYDGDNHVTYPNQEYPNAGRICLIRSKDEGRSWSTPVVIYDDVNDNRDPHINQMSDGTLVLSFFSLKFEVSGSHILKGEEPSYNQEQITKYGNNPDLLHEQQPENSKKKVRPTGKIKWKSIGPYVLKSYNNGKTWQEEAKLITTSTPDWNCSAKVREMPDGSWLLPVYHSEPSKKAAWGGVIPSYDKGKTWGKVVSIGEAANLVLAAETDVLLLNNETLFATLRGDRSIVNMHYALSNDLGKRWSPVKDMGFVGHSPSLTRLKNGKILLSYRGFYDSIGYYTGLQISHDNAKTWQGPYLIDNTPGAYPSTVELMDGSLLAIYYEEGKGSSIRALRFKLPDIEDGKSFTGPKKLETLPLDSEPSGRKASPN